MPRVRIAIVSCVAGCALLAPAQADARGMVPVARKINAVRAHYGLPALRGSGSLARSASRYARHLMRADYFGHAGRIRASSRFSWLGEVLSLRFGWRPNRAAVVQGWMQSPSHRSVLLNGHFRQVGVGRARGRFGSRRATIWVVQFGRR